MKEPDLKGRPLYRPDSVSGVRVADCAWRLKKFQTRTVITEEGGRKLVYKCAATEESKLFLKTIPEKEKLNLEYLKGQFEVLCGSLKNERIEYEYLSYPSLQDSIAECLRQGSYRMANELFEIYVNRLYSLPKIRLVPDEFLRTIAYDTDENILQMDCMRRGLLDLTPRNILVNDSRWIALDNEWSFDFPAPVIFVLFRAIREMAMRMQREIRISAGINTPVIGTFARGLHTYYVPTNWVKCITDARIGLSRLLWWEMGFQKYIAGNFCDTVGRIKRYPKVRVNFSNKAIEADIGVLGKTAQLLKSIPGTRRIVHLFERKVACWRK